MSNEQNDRKHFLDTLKILCDTCGVSGDEQNVADVLIPMIKPYVQHLYQDKLGNLIAFKKGKSATEKTVMYCAHMDEVGMMIRAVNDDGTLLFDQVGMMPEVLPSKHVLIGKQHLHGVICSKPVHLIKDNNQKLSAEHMYIDIGAQNAQQAYDLGVYGAYAAFENAFTFFGGNPDDVMSQKVRSKALDDRIGCAVMVDMMQKELEHDAYFLFTVGEELGGIGVIGGVREIKPDVAVIFESTTASDLPLHTEADRVCVLGDGAVVPFMDGGTLYDATLYQKVRDIGDKADIKTQTKRRVAGGTDAANIQRNLHGALVVAVSLPCRYIHTASCVGCVSDMVHMRNLAHQIDKQMPFLCK